MGNPPFSRAEIPREEKWVCNQTTLKSKDRRILKGENWTDSLARRNILKEACRVHLDNINTDHGAEKKSWFKVSGKQDKLNLMLFVSPLRRNKKCWLTEQAILWSHNLSNHLCHLCTKNFPKRYISNCNFINRVSALADNLTYHLLMENRRQKQLSLNTRNCL